MRCVSSVPDDGRFHVLEGKSNTCTLLIIHSRSDPRNRRCPCERHWTILPSATGDGATRTSPQALWEGRGEATNAPPPEPYHWGTAHSWSILNTRVCGGSLF